MLVSSESVAEECRSRERFVKQRLSRPASSGELKDLTEFFHQEKAEILACSGCSLLMGRELEPRADQTYSEEDYSPEAMEHLFPQYVRRSAKSGSPTRIYFRQLPKCSKSEAIMARFFKPHRSGNGEPLE